MDVVTAKQHTHPIFKVESPVFAKIVQICPLKLVKVGI
jgi:hypothetical protein